MLSSEKENIRSRNYPFHSKFRALFAPTATEYFAHLQCTIRLALRMLIIGEKNAAQETHKSYAEPHRFLRPALISLRLDRFPRSLTTKGKFTENRKSNIYRNVQMRPQLMQLNLDVAILSFPKRHFDVVLKTYQKKGGIRV